MTVTSMKIESFVKLALITETMKIWIAEAVLSFIMTNNDLVFTEQMLLCLEKVRALGVEWSLETGDLYIVLR